MPQDVETNGTEVSDAMSENENEYDDPERMIKDEDGKMVADQNISPEPGSENSGEVKKKYDPKDPLRPRRKKARRACYACQRAHLTCGDERPCQRCIKRGLADACQDGVRKKAKYLHDAPAEALRPVLGPNYNPNAVSKPTNGRHSSIATSETSTYYSQGSSAPTYPIFAGGTPGQVTPLPDSMSFGSQQSPVTPGFQPPSNGRATQMGGMHVPQAAGEMANNFPTALFDPSNPAIFNFDLEGLNFGSHYGALEFGMLGHMSSGAAETPPREAISHPTGSDGSYGPSPIYSNGVNQYSQLYDHGMVDNFINIDQQGSAYSQGNLQHGLPHAYAIAAAGPTPNSLASPGTDNTASPQPGNYGFDKSPTAGTYTPVSASQSIAQPPRPKQKQSSVGHKLGPQYLMGKRQRDPSAIYETVTEPYPYLHGFHNLIRFMERRFSANKSLRIAKSLARIRPSLIACSSHLNRDDLIFMEKCLQRTLFEYDDFMGHCPAPTIVCRRTGEVAAVNKEFIALTGWTRNVLLGKEPNMNANVGRSESDAGSLDGRSKNELTTPRLRTIQPDLGKLDGEIQPVFIAEFMDDDSVIQFYEDFAQLAFGDSRGHVVRKCRLLKYRTKEMSEGISSESPQRDKRSSILSNRVTRIDGEHGISRLEKDGKIDCTFSWTIKRDVFDMPMLMVMNFLPCYYRNQDQLRV
ncbi:transcription factor [Xylariomycetidae sp. FL2044]|nr:transcription factor [Xylariomycetidae sp. FL2044]